MRLKQNLLIACSAFLAVGCSTGTNETKQSVTLVANVPGAMAEIDGIRVGRTPLRVTLDPTRNHEIVVTKPGYVTYQSVLRPTLHNTGNYGFNETVRVSLDTDNGAPNEIAAEDMPTFARAKVLAEAPFGADADTYGTLAGDLDEANRSAERLAATAETAWRNAGIAESNLAKAVAASKDPRVSDDVAMAKLEATEKALRSALDEAKAATNRVNASRKIVAKRIAYLESLQKQGEVLPKEATESLAAARVSSAEADKALAEANARVTLLENKLAEAKLAVEAKTRENRALTYAEYSARKGLIERALRTGEIDKDGYRQALEALDKELRKR